MHKLQKCNQIPICHSEFRLGTEYGHLEVAIGPDGDLSANPNKSTGLNELCTCSLVTSIPPDLML